jgi:hypothetical protein
MLNRVFLKCPSLIAIALLVLPLSAQQAAPTLTVDEIVRRAAEQTSVYVEAFKNLLSEETKTFEIYGRDGDVKKRRVVRSTFIVYQLSKDSDKIIEYRNVISVDGKTLGQTDARAQEFFEKLVKVETSAKELERIETESQRYDEELYISNLTLFQSIALADNLRKDFVFTLTGKDNIDGNEVYVVEYRQSRASPNITIGGASNGMSGLNYDVDLKGLKDVNERLNGKFWIDTQTFQVVREFRVLSIQPPDFETRVPVSENRFEFQKSEFGIMTPSRISHLQFDIDKKKRASVKDVQVVFEYEKFTKPDVDVKASEVKRP